ncbi:MAG: glutamine-hydrolyzing carbamoyl-phosphate synthase small subunit [Nanoarchaeota archaeon]|nr:glutamine-hydrolyzing carbamoyl-phosphate synthase small subunit [Nanoarchaeota archaeon]
MRNNFNGEKANLVLQDGSIHSGKSFGAKSCSSGEVVFNTGMVGYPESMTDPSYFGQILVLTFPLIGNYGVPKNELEDGLLKYFESSKIQVSGLIVADYSHEYSHWNANSSLSDWMNDNNIPGIYGIDTRALTKKLRSQGTMLGRIESESSPEDERRTMGIGGIACIASSNKPKKDFYDPNLSNVLPDVSVSEIKQYGSGKDSRKKIVLIDCGCKDNIVRSLIKRNLSVIRVPWNYDFNKISYDGLFISNGPGNPKMAKETIENIRIALSKEKPIFGICLGNQLLSLAAGADTYKLKFGHRSQNQPCIEIGTKRCYITSQNHGFAVNTQKLPSGWKPWFINANDNTNEGIMHKTKPFFSVQFHPEAAPGPVDTAFLFDKFADLVKNK